MQLRRLVFEDERHSVVHVGRLDDVVVVEHEHHVLLAAFDVVEE